MYPNETCTSVEVETTIESRIGDLFMVLNDMEDYLWVSSPVTQPAQSPAHINKIENTIDRLTSLMQRFNVINRNIRKI